MARFFASWLLLSAPPSQHPSNMPTNEPAPLQEEEPQLLDAVIVGGGWSGLAAARQLASAGHTSIRILEARDYVGGRSRTDRDWIPDGLPVELGSEWLYDGTEIADLMKDLGVSYSEMKGYSSVSLYSDGAALPREKQDALFETAWKNGFLPYARQRAAKMRQSGTDADMQQLLDDYLDQHSTNASEVREFLSAMLNIELITDYAASLDQLSAKSVVDGLGYASPQYFLAVPGGGYSTMIESLAEPLLDRIGLETEVTQIDTTDDDLVKVTYFDKKNMQLRSLSAKTVLVTVPLGVLKANAIKFLPPLPASKREAIDSLGYGTLNKCILYWQDDVSSWWPTTNKTWMGLLTKQTSESGQWTMFDDTKSLQNGDHAILVGWVGGRYAAEAEEQTDINLLLKVYSNLRQMLGDAVPLPTKFRVTRWGRDEYSRGSYSFNAVGRQSDQARRALRETTNGNLFWAGEATDSGWYASTAGAYKSGILAATKIIEYLRD